MPRRNFRFLLASVGLFLLAGCAAAGGNGSGRIDTQDHESIDALAGRWDGPGGTYLNLDAGGRTLLSGVPAETVEQEPGTLCEVMWEPLVAEGEARWGGTTHDVVISNNDDLLGVRLELTLSQNGKVLSGVLCVRGLAQRWEFSRAND